MSEILSINDLHVAFETRTGARARALNGINLRVSAAQVTGLLGESGCGKSTLAKALLGALPVNPADLSGTIQFEGRDLRAMSERDLQKIRGARMALIPQDAGLALNPFLRIGKQVAEVLHAHRDWAWKRCCEEAQALLDSVQLRDAKRNLFEAYPHQLSGGQQQRVAIAQAISCEPALIVADEPTASLDEATERDILQLLRDLRRSRGMALLLITHNPKILHGLADRIAVMYAGRIVEEGAAERILREPRHPYTKALIACMPPEPGERKLGRNERLSSIPGSAPASESEWSGCSFAPRCAVRKAECQQRAPEMRQIEGSELVECLLYER